jgi:hypothetical protein
MHTITAGIIRSICETDSDVLVLNEIHWREQMHHMHMQEEDRYHDYSSYHCEQTKQSIQSSQSLLEEVLRLRGYHYSRVASHGDTPTMIATRKKVLSSKEVILSDNRSALCLLIELETEATTVTSNSNSKSGSSSSSCCWVVGTHLDAFDAEGRRNEIRTLLKQHNDANGRNNNNNNNANNVAVPILIAGDFNQQRSKDYTASEWKKVAGSADLRSVPLEDGVASILEKGGFKCILDDVKFELVVAVAVAAARQQSESDNDSNSNSNRNSNSNSNSENENENNNDASDSSNANTNTNTNTSTTAVLCNWNQTQPPPSTHWSGTTIDYTYYSNHIPTRSDIGSDIGSDTAAATTTTTTTTTIAPHGVYVGRAGFSDHRMTVTDWILTTNTNSQDDNDDDTTGKEEPKRHIDKSFFFHHLPAGRHHSWLYHHHHHHQGRH